MLWSTAVVVTDASARYAKQVLAHLGHKVKVEPIPDRPAPAGRLVFSYGMASVLPFSGRLVLRAAADNAEALARVQDVVKRHLEKFGARRELVVTWRALDTDSDIEPTDGDDDEVAAEDSTDAEPASTDGVGSEPVQTTSGGS